MAEFLWDGPMMSAITGDGVRAVVGHLARLVSEVRREEPDQEAFVYLQPEPEGVWVERVGDREYRVHGRKAERAVALNDVTTPDALGYIDHRLKKLGVAKALSKAGAREGDVVWIGGFSFDYSPEI